MINKEFYLLIRDIVKSEKFERMKGYRHHVKSSAYHHSIRVAYLCYLHHKFFETDIDIKELVRGALLHDFYLYDWHDKNKEHRYHGITHPRAALKNAIEIYPDLTEREMDMILRHMFPLTPRPPKTKAGWIVCFYDKIAALGDYFGKNKWKKKRRRANKIKSAHGKF